MAIIADAQQLRGKFGQRKVALARHAAEMAAPVEQVHLQARRVGPLHDEQLFGANVADAGAGNVARERVEAVERQAERG
jgi:hypothetical protein